METLGKKKLLAGGGMEAAAAMVAAAPEALEEDYDPLLNNNRPVLWSSGCTTLNLALTDNPYEGWPVGRMVNIIGDSSSGKTFLALTALAEAANDPRFDDYDLIFDDIEEANTFDIEFLFGKKLAQRLRPPKMVNGLPKNTSTVEEWYGVVMEHIAAKKPFIYVADSIDAMSDAEEQARAAEYIKLQKADGAAPKRRGKASIMDNPSDDDEEGAEAATQVKGSFKTAKAKLLSEMLRNVISGLAATNSTLFAISQVRVNLNPHTARFSPKTRTGGHALKFYATYEMWLSHIKNIMHVKTKRKIGDECLVKVSKNKVVGKQRGADFPLYYNYGIDDISSCLKFLLEYGALTITGRTLETEAIVGISGTRDTLVAYLEQNPQALKALRDYVGKTWATIEEEIKVKRRPKYE